VSYSVFALFDRKPRMSASYLADSLYDVCDHGIWCNCVVRCGDTGGVQELSEFFRLFLDGHEV
jgi:hypothetical protein